MRFAFSLSSVGRGATHYRFVLALTFLAAAANAVGQTVVPALDRDSASPETLLPEARLNQRFDKPAVDPAEVMPVGSGDLSAMVRFDGTDGRLHLHLSKTDWFANNGAKSFGDSVISPGHVAIAMPGLDPKSVTGFSQQMDLARGAVTVAFATPAGNVAIEVFGVINSNALVASISDSRTNRAGCVAEFVMWRNSMSISATNSRVCGSEVHEYGKPGDLFHNLGIGVEVAFAGPPAVGTGRRLKANYPNGRYELVIAAATTYDGAPQASVGKVMDGLLVQTDREAIRREQAQWWRRFWEQSYLDIRGPDGEYLTKLWYVTLYSYSSVGYGPYPPKFNGGHTVDVVTQKLGYMVRGGDPDFLDSIVPMAYGNLALDLIMKGMHGRIVVLKNGRYDNVPIDVVTSSKKIVKVSENYNVERLRPIFHSFEMKSFLLMASDD